MIQFCKIKCKKLFRVHEPEQLWDWLQKDFALFFVGKHWDLQQNASNHNLHGSEE